jgi:uncharacterized protein
MKNVVVEKSRINGKAVFSNRSFRKDEVILEIDDSRVVTDPSKLTKEQLEFELDYLADGKIVITQALERYINHSCDPNSYVKTLGGVRRLLAMRRIQKGEEIVEDYSINGYNKRTFNCRCGSSSCRCIYRGNYELPKALQRKYLPYLDDWFLEKFKDKITNLRRSE